VDHLVIRAVRRSRDHCWKGTGLPVRRKVPDRRPRTATIKRNWSRSDFDGSRRTVSSIAAATRMGEPGWPMPPMKVSAMATRTRERVSRAGCDGRRFDRG